MPDRPPASHLQVTVLGSGGGPDEMNTTAFLIRPTALHWAPGSVLALDAGVHIGAITRIFEQSLQRARKSNPKSTASTTPNSARVLDDGPFEGFTCHGETPGANAAYVMRKLIRSYLITHPHLDHVAGIVTCSASMLPPLVLGKPEKVIAGLPSTIEAIKTHLFNGLIWPNLSNEGLGAAGFFEYLRLRDGGTEARGEMSDANYTNICEGLSIFARSVTHGNCCAEFPLSKVGHRHDTSFLRIIGASLSVGLKWILNTISRLFRINSSEPEKRPYDSTAYFVKDNESGTEILVCGDIQPDSVSDFPRNKIVWQDAAPKINAGTLKAIFMECSFDSSQPEDHLFGHMSPKYVMEELQVLANLVSNTGSSPPKPPTEVPMSGPRIRENEPDSRRAGEFQSLPPTEVPMSGPRIRENEPDSRRAGESQSLPTTSNGPLSNIVNRQADSPGNRHTRTRSPIRYTEETDENMASENRLKPLDGLTVVIIHMKEKLADGLTIQEVVEKELTELEEQMGLGCKFIISKAGMSLLF